MKKYVSLFALVFYILYYLLDVSKIKKQILQMLTIANIHL